MKYLSAFVVALCLISTTFAYDVNDNFAERKVSLADAHAKVNEAARVFKEIMDNSAQAIPSQLLEESEGIVIIPDLIKVGFGIGGKAGRGVLVIRNNNGQWSSPVFISLIGGSIGWQVGAQSSDIILVFKTRQSVERVVAGKFTLGADVGVAAGPVGGNLKADLEFKSEIYSYSRSRGLFAGLALDGSILEIDHVANEGLYKEKVSVADIFLGNTKSSSAEVRKFKRVLHKHTKRKGFHALEALGDDD